MLKLQPLDENTPITVQLNGNESPVVLVNLFKVNEEDIPDLLKAWEADANWMKRQPGYISTQLHQGISGSTTFMNYAVWDSVEDFRNAFTHPDFEAAMGSYPDSAIAQPHLFKKMGVSNLCTE